MQNVFIINAHEPWPFSEGKLNRSMFERATTHLQSKGYGIQTTTMQDDYDVEKEIEKHMWADVLILQTPCNWMGVPWTFKKYMDEVYTAGRMVGCAPGTVAAARINPNSMVQAVH